jgi:hypothetical protein
VIDPHYPWRPAARVAAGPAATLLKQSCPSIFRTS